jgi:hypothetical protein
LAIEPTLDLLDALPKGYCVIETIGEVSGMGFPH